MPAIGLIAFGNQYCTGTLIAPDVDLTAAHCIGAATTTFRTTSGTPIATVPHAVAEKKPYPSWVSLGCPNPTRDIGLLRLAHHRHRADGLRRCSSARRVLPRGRLRPQRHRRAPQALRHEPHRRRNATIADWHSR